MLLFTGLLSKYLMEFVKDCLGFPRTLKRRSVGIVRDPAL